MLLDFIFWVKLTVAIWKCFYLDIDLYITLPMGHYTTDMRKLIQAIFVSYSYYMLLQGQKRWNRTNTKMANCLSLRCKSFSISLFSTRKYMLFHHSLTSFCLLLQQKTQQRRPWCLQRCQMTKYRNNNNVTFLFSFNLSRFVWSMPIWLWHLMAYVDKRLYLIYYWWRSIDWQEGIEENLGSRHSCFYHCLFYLWRPLSKFKILQSRTSAELLYDDYFFFDKKKKKERRRLIWYKHSIIH